MHFAQMWKCSAVKPLASVRLPRRIYARALYIMAQKVIKDLGPMVLEILMLRVAVSHICPPDLNQAEKTGSNCSRIEMVDEIIK